MKRILLLVLIAASVLAGASGCSSSGTDEHGVVRSDGGWF